MRNRFKGLDLIDIVPEELWMEVHDIVQEAVIKTIPKKKAKWLSEEAVQTAMNRREAKGKGEKESYTHLNAELQKITRKDKKAFLSNQFKEIEENNRMEKTRDFFKKMKTPREHFMQRWAQSRTEMVWTQQKQKILREGGKNTQMNCTKKIFTTQIIMMV